MISATQIWDLLENRRLFSAMGENQEVSATDHIAEMVAYLGLPPLEYLRRSDVTKNVFNDQGQSSPYVRLFYFHSNAISTGFWKGAGGVQVPSLSLEQAEMVLKGRNKECFLDFVRKMLRWVPEDRKSATELLEEPWLQDAGS